MKELIHDEYLTLQDIAAMYDIPYGTIKVRYHRGKRGEELIVPLGTRVDVARTYEVHGEHLTPHEISDKYGISYGTIKVRYHRGKRGADLIVPVQNNTKHNTP